MVYFGAGPYETFGYVCVCVCVSLLLKQKTQSVISFYKMLYAYKYFKYFMLNVNVREQKLEIHLSSVF